MMKNARNILFAIVCFLFLMMTSGVYATWRFSEGAPLEQSDTVNAQMNEFTFAPQATLHITAVQLHSTSNASNVAVSFTHPTYISSTVNSNRTNATVTYKVTVYNNTDVTYWYLGPSWQPSHQSNGLIGATNGITVTTRDNSGDAGATFNTDDWVPPYTYRDFYITYQFGANAVSSGISTLLSLDFGLKMDSVHDEFLAILNDTVSATGYQYLSAVFDQRYQQNGSTVIANVGADKQIFDTLFGGQPTISVGGQDVPVTIMIQRENVDNRATGDSYNVNGGPTGCEYTLYLTVDALNSPTGEAIVYAVSYSCGGESGIDQWYQLGELYEGTAPKELYDNAGNIAFDVDEWKASANEYEFIDGYYYKVGYEQGDQYAKYKTIEELMSANDQNFYNAIDNSQMLRKVYAVVYNSANYNKPGYDGLRTAFEVAAPFYTVHNNGQEVKIKRVATRAELLPYIEAIQHAYTYYNQVNP